MLSNLLVLLLFIGLFVLFAWLCYRSIRAQKLWVKIVGGVGFALLAMLVVFIGFSGGKGIAMTYFPNAPDAPNITVAGTPICWNSAPSVWPFCTVTVCQAGPRAAGGRRVVERSTALAARLLGVPAAGVLACATGRIGVPVPERRLLAGVRAVKWRSRTRRSSASLASMARLRRNCWPGRVMPTSVLAATNLVSRFGSGRMPKLKAEG